jgi:Uma2 family endonuclease
VAQPAVPIYTYAEYLERLEASNIRLEFVDGVVYAMAGGSPEHNRLCMRLTLHIGNQLRPPCEAYGPDQKVRALGAGYFPDLSVVCGEPMIATDDPHAITNPRVVFEVLSRSTANVDRTTKAERYKTLSSLTEYVIIWQSERRVQVHRRAGDAWVMEEHGSGGEAALSCGVRLVVDAVYP